MKLHVCLVTFLVACAGDPMPLPHAPNDPSNPGAPESPFAAPPDALSSRTGSATAAPSAPPPAHDMQHMMMDGGMMNMPMMPGGR